MSAVGLILGGLDERMWHQNTGVSLVIRTDFAHPQEWARIQRTAIEPQTEEGFDTETLTHPDQPILVVNLYDYAEGPEDQGKGPQYGATNVPVRPVRDLQRHQWPGGGCRRCGAAHGRAPVVRIEDGR